MGAFHSQDIINIVLAASTVATSLLALYYKRLEHRRQVEQVIESGRRAGLFLSREAMVRYLLEMYDKAEGGDVIWAQCVRCTDFTPEVRKKILEAAGRGVRFQMIINGNSPSASEFRTLFDPVETAVIYERNDNRLSLQGLSDREVVIALPGVESYTAVLVRDKCFVGSVREWFDQRNYTRCKLKD